MSDKAIPHPSVFVEARRLELIKGYRVHESRTPAKPVRVVTPSQTVGPFYPQALIHPRVAQSCISHNRRIGKFSKCRCPIKWRHPIRNISPPTENC